MSAPSRLPPELLTERLLLRPPEAADAKAVNAAVRASFAELTPFMEWAAEPPALAVTQAFCETGTRELATGGGAPLLMFRRSDGAFVGGAGIASMDLAVPRFELGYWVVTALAGRGYVSEAVRAQARHLFAEHGAAHLLTG